jgi:amidohydrolase
MMAAPDEFGITVKGLGGHGCMPQTAVDPILVASQLVVNLQSIVSRNVDPLKSAVLSLGTIQGGTIYNIIPSEVHFTGTVRTFDPELRDYMEKRIREMAEGTCKAFGATAEVRYQRGYPALINHDPMAELVQKATRRVLGEDALIDIDPSMGGEDFAYFLQEVPGAFLFFGMGDGMEFPHHNPKFDIDEKALPQAAALMSSVALDYLGGR